LIAFGGTAPDVVAGVGLEMPSWHRATAAGSKKNCCQRKRAYLEKPQQSERNMVFSLLYTLQDEYSCDAVLVHWPLSPRTEHNQAGIPRLAVVPRRCSRSIYSGPDIAPENK
jgi:hypothetical protein